MSGLGPKTANTYNQVTPTNYVAGIGRGATGFTTRSDIGPARPAAAPSAVPEVQFGAAPAGYVAGMGRGMGMLAREQGELSGKQVADMNDGDRADYSESNYDEFSGYGEKLFSSNTPYEEDDVEADRIYEAIDERMEGRRKRRREIQMLEEMKKKRSGMSTIADQFADLKVEDLSIVLILYNRFFNFSSYRPLDKPSTFVNNSRYFISIS